MPDPPCPPNPLDYINSANPDNPFEEDLSYKPEGDPVDKHGNAPGVKVVLNGCWLKSENAGKYMGCTRGACRVREGFSEREQMGLSFNL